MERRVVRSVSLIVLAAVNLRPAVASVGPLLTDISADLRLSGTAAGALTTLPVLCFGIFGLIAPALRGRFREESLLVASLGLLVVGLLVRVGPSVAALFGGALLIGVAISVGNVTMPALIKREHPGQVTPVSAIYGTALAGGAALAASVVVPIRDGTGGDWRLPLALLVVPAALAALAWLPRARHAPSTAAAAGGAGPAPSLWRNRLAWHVTLFMGLQSLLAYATFGWLPALCEDRGMSSAAAGLVLGLTAFVQAVGTMAVPVIDRRFADQRPAVALATGLTLVGFCCVAWAPLGAVWPAAVILGLGQGALFALALAFIGLRAGDAPTAGRLSGMAQGIGYLLAATGPLVFGALHDLTGGWSVPIGFVLAVTVLQLGPGLAAGRLRTVRAS
jgi:MFS transporter, CP family, cyanate transporter